MEHLKFALVQSLPECGEAKYIISASKNFDERARSSAISEDTTVSPDLMGPVRSRCLGDNEVGQVVDEDHGPQTSPRAKETGQMSCFHASDVCPAHRGRFSLFISEPIL